MTLRQYRNELDFLNDLIRSYEGRSPSDNQFREAARVLTQAHVALHLRPPSRTTSDDQEKLKQALERVGFITDEIITKSQIFRLRKTADSPLVYLPPRYQRGSNQAQRLRTIRSARLQIEKLNQTTISDKILTAFNLCSHAL
jgi:hypothetical protein